jgi:hypothetical protein
MKSGHVSGKGAGVITAVGRYFGRRIPTHERGHGAIASLSQFREEMAIGPRRVWKSMQTQRQGALPHL